MRSGNQPIQKRTAGLNSNQQNLITNTSSDSAEIEWIADYSSGLTSSDDRAWAVAIDNSNNIYIFGTSYGR